jgi:hypothetical protein
MKNFNYEEMQKIIGIIYRNEEKTNIQESIVNNLEKIYLDYILDDEKNEEFQYVNILVDDDNDQKMFKSIGVQNVLLTKEEAKSEEIYNIEDVVSAHEDILFYYSEYPEDTAFEYERDFYKEMDSLICKARENKGTQLITARHL